METTMSSFLITIAVTVLLVGGFYTKRMIENLNSYIPRFDGAYYLFALNSNDTSLAATQDRLVGLTDYDYHLMKNYENFDKIIFSKTLDFYLINHQVDEKYRINQVEARKEFNYDENDNTVSFLNMIGYEDEQLSYLKNFVIEGEINIDNIKKGNEFIWNISSLKAQDLGLSYKVGDKLKLSKVINNKRVDIDVTIGAVIDTANNITIDDKNNMTNYRIPIICSADTFENLNLDFGFDGFAFLLKDKDDYKDLNMKILEISRNYQADDVQIVYDSVSLDIKSVKKNTQIT